MGHRGSLGRDKRQAVFYSKLILLTPPQKHFSVSHESQMAPQQTQNFNTAATTCGQKRFTGEADPHQLRAQSKITEKQTQSNPGCQFLKNCSEQAEGPGV